MIEIDNFVLSVPLVDVLDRYLLRNEEKQTFGIYITECPKCELNISVYPPMFRKRGIPYHCYICGNIFDKSFPEILVNDQTTVVYVRKWGKFGNEFLLENVGEKIYNQHLNHKKTLLDLFPITLKGGGSYSRNDDFDYIFREYSELSSDIRRINIHKCEENDIFVGPMKTHSRILSCPIQSCYHPLPKTVEFVVDASAYFLNESLEWFNEKYNKKNKRNN